MRNVTSDQGQFQTFIKIEDLKTKSLIEYSSARPDMSLLHCSRHLWYKKGLATEEEDMSHKNAKN